MLCQWCELLTETFYERGHRHTIIEKTSIEWYTRVMHFRVLQLCVNMLEKYFIILGKEMDLKAVDLLYLIKCKIYKSSAGRWVSAKVYFHVRLQDAF
jgi:hypothetical protein